MQDPADIADQKIDAYEAMGTYDCKAKADEFVQSLVEAGEEAWLGWLLYVLERLDPISVVEDAEGNPYFLIELCDEIDNRFCEGVW